MRHLPKILTVAVAGALAVGLSACSSGPSAAAPKPTHTFAAGTQMAEIQQRGKLIVGVKDDFPLFGMKNPVTGQLEGMDIQLADRLAQELTGSASNIQYVVVTSADREAFLQQHKVDVVIATYPPNPARMAAVDFAGPYLMSPVSVMVRTGDKAISRPADMNGKNICVTAGSGAVDMVPQNAPTAHLMTLATITECMQALEQNRVDGVATTNSILLGLISQNPGKFEIAPGNLLKNGKPASDNDSIGLPKGEKAFHDYLDSFLTKIEADGTWKKIYADTVGKVSHDSPTPPPIMY
ncbi:MAG TPA: glutamate ABC transporter substrate-binding protein [Microbacterium sp.]|uniref:glutamate ABC transporter substrate-binding protein n=1 Tax=Microbacterium sp. TaxID=51671 RepID=UPI002B49E4C7|nr:glutamate ABC transporter substrate-binding protein [Microbacterium sp.]HKT56939.1 glutamate ABC transporter substrate-binding protein [Microbacterium sp.]